MSYQDVKDKLYHGHRKIANNTYLTLEQPGRIEDMVTGYYEDEPNHIDMRLHGNLVARFYPNYLQLYSADWYTPTTKDRLNLALELSGIPPYIEGGVRTIYQWRHQWYYNNDLIRFYDGIKIDYTGKVID